MSLKCPEYWKVWTSLTPWQQSKLHPLCKTHVVARNPRTNYRVEFPWYTYFLCGFLLRRLFADMLPVGASVLFCQTEDRLMSAAPPASLSLPSASLSPFLYFLSHCSCTQGSRFSIDYFLSSNPTFLMAAHFFFLTLWRLCTDSTPCNVNGPFPALFNAVLKSDCPIIHCLLKLVHPL